jgi:adhesin/invasin
MNSLGPTRSLCPAAGLALLLGTGIFSFAACDWDPLLAPAGSAITLTSSPAAVPADGSSEITAFILEGALGAPGTDGSAEIVPGVGTPVHNGTVVLFSTTMGRMEPAEALTTSGRAMSRLIADGRSGVATVTATSGPASQTLEVTIGAAAAARVVVSANPQSLDPGGGTSTIQAVVEDDEGNALAGVPLAFSTNAGSLDAANGVTDASGRATTTLTTTSTATVTVRAGSGAGTLTGTVSVTVRSGS